MLTLASVQPHANTARRFEKRINRTVVKSVVNVIDRVYKDRDYARFYVLETVARVPYFSFVSVLHLYETLGVWRKADFLETHFAQTMNEYHHLLIMEDLGGDERFVDRFFAQHTAFAYYWLTCLLYTWCHLGWRTISLNRLRNMPITHTMNSSRITVRVSLSSTHQLWLPTTTTMSTTCTMSLSMSATMKVTM
jgi:hypothetical protein